jgi:hypothetical protein
VPDGLNWPVWRLIIRRITTLREIEEHWCLSDLVFANEALDLEEEIERKAAEARAARQGG